MGIIIEGKDKLSIELRTGSFTIMDITGDSIELDYKDYKPLIELLEDNQHHVNFTNFKRRYITKEGGRTEVEPIRE